MAGEDVAVPIALLKSAREELMKRIDKRDGYLKIQLLVQASLFALASGIKIGGVESKSNLPILLGLAVPASFLFLLVYFTEDRLIGLLSRYIRNQFTTMNPKPWMLQTNWLLQQI